MLLSPDSIDRIEFLREQHFYLERHRQIFAVLCDLIERGRPVDVLLAADALESRVELEGIGGLAYLGALAQNTPSAANIKRYAEIVFDRYLLRELQARCVDFHEKASINGASPQALVQEAEAAFLSIMEPSQSTEEISLGRAAMEAVEAREEVAKTFPTGFVNLDRMLADGGLRAGQIAIVAGRSSMGKSAFMQQIAQHVARRDTVAYFTLEMSRRELAERALSYHERKLGLNDAIAHMARLKFQIDETPAVTLSHIRQRCRRIRRKHGLAMIVVDYLQLMSGKGENRTQEIGSLSRGLKSIAKELDVPVVVGAQINRGVEGRPDRRPLLSDLRESGDIENDADVVLMLFREDYYNPECAEKGLAEVIVRKQRNGPVGTLYMRFTPEETRFEVWEGQIPHAKEQKRGGVVSAIDFKTRVTGERD